MGDSSRGTAGADVSRCAPGDKIEDRRVDLGRRFFERAGGGLGPGRRESGGRNRGIFRANEIELGGDSRDISACGINYCWVFCFLVIRKINYIYLLR